MSFFNVLELFLTECKIKNLSKASIRSYEQKLNFYFKFTDELTSEAVKEFTLDCQIKGLHTATINSYLRAIRALVNYASEEDYIIPFKVRLLKEDLEAKEGYSYPELTKLLQKPDLKTCSFTEYKIWVLENFLLGTGCRISTALEIKVDDIDFDGGYILFRHTKNRKNQYFPLSNNLALIIKKYLIIRKGSESDYLFCNSYGSKADLRTIQNQVKHYNLSRGVERSSCHDFRRTFTSDYIRSGGDIFRLQQLLGHYDISMTKRYYKMYNTDLKIGFDELDPLSKFNPKRDKIKMKWCKQDTRLRAIL